VRRVLHGLGALYVFTIPFLLVFIYGALDGVLFPRVFGIQGRFTGPVHTFIYSRYFDSADLFTGPFAAPSFPSGRSEDAGFALLIGLDGPYRPN